MTRPVKNSLHELTVHDVNADGFGVSRLDDFIVFTRGALPGDVLRARLLKVKQRYAYAKIEQLITPSPHRKRDDTVCPLAGQCGGCQFQHCEYGAQLAFKKQNLLSALTRIGGLADPPVADALGMETPYHYRNKAVFPVGRQGIGVYAPRSHRVVPVTRCNIQHPAHEPLLAAVWAYMRRFNVPAYDETTHTGLLRQVMVRTGNDAGEVMAVCVVNGDSLPQEPYLTEWLSEAGATTVLINRHTQPGNTVLGDHFRVLSGAGVLRQRVGPLVYRLSARSFFQVNTAQAQMLYENALALGGFDGSETVIDAHAGVGGVALYAARHVRQVYGVDTVPEAVADAEANAEANGIANAAFIRGAAEDVVPRLLRERPADAVFLDPPRKGCGAALLNALTYARVRKVLYISCEPATLARDVALLGAGGYRLEAVRPVDMFPQTGKVECVCLLIHSMV